MQTDKPDSERGVRRSYRVILSYNNSPDFRTTVSALSTAQAITIATLDATADGWPSEYVGSIVEVGS